ncbi:MAG: FKBP-type peptidyl-prolyl cis-trans isomerase [Paludibacteraceae bacterium]|nr:FKBP-type peptidyl-prolyl cis-trans isomerase [Paludibacteraceae bacterium]
MKKLLIVGLVLLVGVASAEAKSKKARQAKEAEVPTVTIQSSQAKLETKTDSALYALGVNLATNLSMQLDQVFGTEVSKEKFLEAFREVLGDVPVISQMTPEFANDYLNRYMRQLQEEATAKNIEEEKKFLDENRKREGVIETQTGLQYQVVRMGDGPMPTVADRVKVHYEGTLLDGTKFDSSYDRGEPVVFGLSQVIPGWTEGLQLMPVGSKFVLYIPSALGYGPNGAGGAIPPYSTLIFEVELLSIEQ